MNKLAIKLLATSHLKASQLGSERSNTYIVLSFRRLVWIARRLFNTPESTVHRATEF